MGDQVEIRCLCGDFTALVHLKAPIPVDTTICNCNICRQTSGTLYWSGIRISDAPVDLVEQKLVKYDATTKGSRYFCPKCGTHMIYHMKEDDGWGICSGAVDRVIDENVAGKGQLEKVVDVEYSADSVDGGLAACFKDETGQDVPQYAGEVYDGKWDGLSKTQSVDGQDKLYAACHCKGTQFYLAKPDSAHGFKPDESKWWLIPDKYLAGFCMCRTCRLAAGQPIFTWVFVPEEKILQSNGSQRTQDVFGSLRRYESSPGVFRDFCSTCGACVFYVAEDRPGVVDVSVGVLRAPEGSRAENWLSWWTGNISHSDAALDKDLAKRFASGLTSLNSA